MDLNQQYIAPVAQTNYGAPANPPPVEMAGSPAQPLQSAPYPPPANPPVEMVGSPAPPVEMVGSPAPPPHSQYAAPANPPIEMVGSPVPSVAGGGIVYPPPPSTVSAPSEYNPKQPSYDTYQQQQQYPPTYQSQSQPQHQQYYDPEKAMPTATATATGVQPIIPGPAPGTNTDDGGFVGGVPTVTVFGRISYPPSRVRVDGRRLTKEHKTGTFPKKRFLIYVAVAVAVLVFIIGLSAGLAGRKQDKRYASPRPSSSTFW